MSFSPREPASADAARPRATPAPESLPLSAEQVLALQRTAGNAAVARLLRAPAAEEKRYDFAVTLYSTPKLHKGLTSAQVIEKFRQLWSILHQQLDRGRGRHLELLAHRRNNSTAGYWSDLLGGAELPDPDIWNAVGGGPLRDLDLLLKSDEATLKGAWEAGEAVIDRGLPAALRNNPYMAFDATAERIMKAARLVEQAVKDLDECERRVDQYRDDHVRGAGRAITGINVTIVVLSAATAGAGASAAGGGLATQAAVGAGISGTLGVAHEAFTQLGEIRIGERESFDVARIAKRGARDVVAGFVGGVVAGKFSRVISARVGGWVGKVPQALLDKYGIARADLLMNSERLFIQWISGTASTPFATTAAVLMDSAMAGKLTVKTWGDFTTLVFDDLVASAALGGFLTYAGHALPPRAPAAPAPKSTPASAPKRGTGTPPSGGRPPTEEPLSARPIKRARPYNHKTPARETRVYHDPRGDHKRRRFAGSKTELRTNVRAAIRQARKEVDARHTGGKRPTAGIHELIAEIRQTDPKFADQVQLYYAKLTSPRFLEESMTALWDEARKNGRTVAAELEFQLGGDKHGVNAFRNDPNLSEQQQFDEFRRALEDPRVLIDMAFASDHHGSHTHAFQEYLGNRLWGPGGGRKFRQTLLAFKGGSTETLQTGQGPVTKPFWARVWDNLFDAYNDAGLHSPEVLGKVLQQELDLPRWQPPPTAP